MKHSHMHKFSASFDKVQNLTLEKRKSLLRTAVIHEAQLQYREYPKNKNYTSFFTLLYLIMKNTKIVALTSTLALIALISALFAPSVMAQVAVNNGLDYLDQFTPVELVENGYNIDINFEDSLTEAKNANDLKIISEKNAIAEFSNESDMSMTIGKAISPGEPGYVEQSQVEMIGNGTMEDPYRAKDESLQKYQSDSRITKYLQYTNPSGKKVTLGIDINNLPIIMKISQ